MLNIILYQPEIAPNTGNIIRLCFSLGAKLHIIKPIAFELKPKWLKRAAAGKFLTDIQHEIHSSYQAFEKKYSNIKIYYVTRYGQKIYSNIKFTDSTKQNVWIMFGRESTGIPKTILNKSLSTCIRIPMTHESRSLNLANSVAIIGYEIKRQESFKGLSEFEVQKGKNWITTIE